MRIIKSLSIVVFLVLPLIGFGANSKKIIISEFLAANSTILEDEDGDYSDWIELYNTGNTTINLNGWRLTDSEKKPNKWIFPSVSISPGQYMIVFASGKERDNPQNELHTNFSLSKDGEYLAIIEPDGTISDEYSPEFPPQQSDVSYGYYQGEYVYFEIPTPGAENTIKTKAGTPVFNIERGYYDNAFSVSLTVPNPDTKIYYTTDGTRPTEQSTLYTVPVEITRTTPLSAVGIKNGTYSPIITNTYFFISDIINQPSNPAGYPDRWGYLGSATQYANYAVGQRAPADYAMDANVCNNPVYKNLINEAFLSIPSVSIVTNVGYLFSESTDENEGGIYIHTGMTLGSGWERPASIEYYNPVDGKQFQINCGLQLHGGASRRPERTGKHSFRTYFRKEYGEGKLKFDLFEDTTAVTEFDRLVFRAGYNYSWTHAETAQRNNSQYIIDSFAKRTQRMMGHVSTHDKFVHLYINGLYWGLYNISERPDDKFMASYFGGEDVDYDVVNHSGLDEGDISAYKSMVALSEAGNFEQLQSEKLISTENYIDYMLLNFYIGNIDWPHNNWYASRNRINPDDGFNFFSWDAETSLTDVNLNRITGITGDFRKILFGSSSGFSTTGGGLYNNEEFLLLFADRVQKHFFNDGSLTAEKTAQLYSEITNEIDLPIILESARWGDYRKNVLPPKGQTPPLYTRNDHWLPQKEKLLKDYFTKRTDVTLGQLSDLGLTSKIGVPVFSSYGGKVDYPFSLSINAASGTIYYTTNGEDPRNQGGGIAVLASAYHTPLLLSGACTVKARVKNGQTWSALTEAVFKQETPSAVRVVSENTLNVGYHDNTLRVTLPESGIFQVDIYSLDGKTVIQKNINGYSGNNNIDVGMIHSGVYVYKIAFNGVISRGKFMK